MTDADTRRWQTRRLASDAAFLLPYLRAGLDVLDVGCGPGSITLGLAAKVAPGRVLGIDLDRDRIATASRAAREAALDTVTFATGDAYSLPAEGPAFDVVFANGLLEHLPDPAAALCEFIRVLKPGGLLALRSPDWGTAIVEPAEPALLDSIALRNRWQRHDGGDPEAGRKLKGWIAATGLEVLAAQAEGDRDGAAGSTRDYMRRVLLEPDLTALAETQGWAAADAIAGMADAWSAWADRPDAFAGLFWCHAVGRKAAAATS